MGKDYGGFAEGIARRVGVAIRRARLERDWRQDDLAEATGIAQGVISKWERGLGAPSIAELAWIERALGLGAGELFVEAAVVPAAISPPAAIRADPKLAEPERDFVVKAYEAALAVSRAERGR